MTTIDLHSAPVASYIQENREKKANKFALRAQAKADAARQQTKTFAAFTPFEQAEFVRHCRARYNSNALEGVNWADVLTLTSEDFSGPLFERQQVEWLKERAKLLQPLEEIFGA